ncbi:site-specific integrase [Nocardia vinacea]|uniref:site-specific integrase n=1 Tax=Nocardia vinacea TaxID=96468 RepID=UPI003F4CF607
MTSLVKHTTRKPLPAVTSVAGEQRLRNGQLRNEFPARPRQDWWPHTAATAEQVQRRLAAPPFASPVNGTRAGRRRGVAKLLRWLSSFPGETWQDRWLASGAEECPGAEWVKLPTTWMAETCGRTGSCDSVDMQSGLLMLICGDVLRPGLPWMLTRAHRYLATVMAEVRDESGFARLADLAAAEPASSAADAKIAATRIATILACKGGGVADIVVGDCVELVETIRRVQTRGGQKKVDFYLQLRALGVFPGSAPHSIRAFGLAGGRLTIEQCVDRYRIKCRPIRDLLVDYLRERQPSLDFTSLDAASRTLAGLFWARIETLAPGSDTLRLPPEVVRAWKESIATVERNTTSPTGERIKVAAPRLNYKDELLRVRALYLDIAHWAVEDPARWGPWVAPCPITDAEVQKGKDLKHRKARMDQRTRERLPVLPALVRTAHDRRLATARLLAAAELAEPGAVIDGTDGALRKAVAPKAIGRLVWAEDVVTGKRRNLSYEKEEAFWAFATIEVLRLTGIRCEELLELSHHSITEYRLPGTGELVPLLQIAPSKTDTERMLLVSPELADVLSAIVQRLRGPDGSIPLVVAYDIRGKDLESAHAGVVPARHRQRAPRVHGMRDPQAADQCSRGVRAHRRQRRSADVSGPRLPEDIRHRRHHERPATTHRAGHLRAQNNRHHNGLQGRLPSRDDRGASSVHGSSPRHTSQRRIPDADRRGMGLVLRALREKESVGRHLRPSIRLTLRS